MNNSRRNFIKIVGLGGSSFVLSNLLPTRLLAQSAEPHFFVLLGYAGAMDATLGLNPFTHAKFGTEQKHIFLEYREDEILRANGLQLGPAAHSLSPYASDICVLNGINMRLDSQHNLGYIFSGVSDNSKMNYAHVASSIVQESPSSITLGDSFSSFKKSDVFTIDAASYISSELENAQSKISEQDTMRSGIDVLSICSDGRTQNQIFCKISDSKDLRSTKENWDRLQNMRTEANQNYILLASALMSGTVSSGVSAEFRFEEATLDTHENHEGRHLRCQKAIWEEVAGLFKIFKSVEFKGKTLFDYTTFMVATEFSRTPYLNGIRGKDHNFETNSILLAGKNIQGGKTIGDSFIIKGGDDFSRHVGAAIDYKNGNIILTAKELETASNASRIYPENVARTIAKLFNDDVRAMNVSSKYQVIPGILK